MNVINGKGVSLLTVVLLAFGFLGFATMSNAGDASPTLQITPNKTVLSPALIKNPVTFSGSGWKANEMIVIDLLLPPGVKVKGVVQGEDAGLAFATADANGNFETKVGPLATLNTLIQVAWVMQETGVKPDFKQATPLPPGVYTLRASGIESGQESTSTLTILPKPKKD